MSVVEIKNLSKKFGDFTALKNINLRLNKGEILGFIGPNGAGKSTTIKILLGILKATSGEVKIFGKDAFKDAVEIHSKIAYVPGDVNLWPNLSGGEVIDMFLSLHNSKNKDYRDELIKRFDFDPTKKCKTYSKGNRQKVALIAAFTSDADLYILDEPTSGLDPLMERIFQECVLKLKDDGKSVLLSSHILSEVEKLCDRIAIIRKGEIIETGSLKEMSRLTRASFSVKTLKPVIDFEKLSGVYDVVFHEDSFNFQVDSDRINDVIKYISEFCIMSIQSINPTLEDLFMNHYESDRLI